MKAIAIIVIIMSALVWFGWYVCHKQAEALSKICGLEVTATDVFWAGDTLRCMNSATIKR